MTDGVPRSEKSDVMVSVLTVIQNDQAIVGDFLTELHAVLEERYKFFEILVIDLHSTDGSLPIVLERLEHTANLRLLRLSTRSDPEIGMAAGLDHCIGDYAVIMNGYFDRPADVCRLVAAAQEGYEVVVAERIGAPHGRFFRRFFYALASRMLEIPIDSHESGFRLMSRKVVASVTKIKNRRRYLRYFNALLNFKKRTIACTVHERVKMYRGGPGFFSSVRRAIDILISHSAAPLRWTAALGVLASFGNLTYLLYVFVVALVKSHLAEGWLTTSVMMSTMFCCLFLILSVLSEYVARIMEESQTRPLYFIELEAESTGAGSTRQHLNVVEAEP